MLEVNGLSLNQMLQVHTHLSAADMEIIETLCGILDYIASLTESDIFINALTVNGYDSVVLKWAKPQNGSLYTHSVVGQLAHPFNEPAVYQTLVSGKPSFGVRGLSQERIPIAQTVVPVRNPHGNIIAALIMERDITEQVNQEAQVELLSETAEHLARTLMGVSVNKTSFPDHLREGVIVLDGQGDIQYMNHMADGLLQVAVGTTEIPCRLQALPQQLRESLEIPDHNRAWSREATFAQKYLKIEGIPLITRGNVEGAVIILSDITDLRLKEKELILKSVAIQEIHHRVKNNLQNIASLLRLQMRRLDHPLVKDAFADSIRRILSMAMVYDVLANQSMDEVDLKELCAKIIELSFAGLCSQECKIDWRIVGISFILPSIQAATLSLMLNELISNTFKHAFAGRENGSIYLEIEDCGSEIQLQIKDDGVGFSPQMDEKGHLGLKIVKILAEEKLNGSFYIIKQQQGTCAVIRFPKEL